jgi:hypothetical protein
MNCRPTVESWYGAPGSWKALVSPSNSERWVCMPDPGCSANGLGMNEAWMPCSSATSLMTARKVMMLSAVESASAYRRSISFCPGAPS